MSYHINRAPDRTTIQGTGEYEITILRTPDGEVVVEVTAGWASPGDSSGLHILARDVLQADEWVGSPPDTRRHTSSATMTTPGSPYRSLVPKGEP